MSELRTSAPPADTADLLAQLRCHALLDADQQQRLTRGWPADLSPADAVAALVQASLLTPFQAERVLAGRVRSLRFGPYALLEQLGSGASGEVYRAEHRLMRRVVALKVFRRRRAASSRVEVRTTSELSHPNLVAAHHAGRSRGRFVLVLEYVDGIDLARLVAQTGPLPVDLVCAVARQAAAALGYLHGEGLLHRDVKPSNLLLSHVGADSRPVVKLIDLGLASRAGVEEELCGTVDYLAPERGLGEPIDGRSDLYSLGCTLYFLLTGGVPFPGGSWTSKMLRHRMETPEPIAKLCPHIPLPVAALVSRLMATNPDDRFADAAALIAALDDVEAPAAIPLAQPVTPKRWTGWATLGRIAAAAVLLGICVGGAARLTVAQSGVLASAGPVSHTNALAKSETALDLQQRIDETPDGGVITLSGPGPYRTAPLVSRNKRLTIRAAPGTRPRIERSDSPASTWDALVSSAHELTLIGLELSGGPDEPMAPLVSCSGRLKLTDCIVKGRTAGPLIALRQGESLQMERVRLDATARGVAVELGPKRLASITIEDSQIQVRDVAGAAVLVWSPELGGADCAVRLNRCTLDAGRILALRSLSGTTRVEAVSSRLSFVEALISLDGCRDRDWRKHLAWHGRENVWATRGAFVRQDGRAIAWDESAAQVAGR